MNRDRRYCSAQGVECSQQPVYGGPVLAPLRSLLQRCRVDKWAELKDLRAHRHPTIRQPRRSPVRRRQHHPQPAAGGTMRRPHTRARTHTHTTHTHRHTDTHTACTGTCAPARALTQHTLKLQRHTQPQPQQPARGGPRAHLCLWCKHSFGRRHE